MSSLKDYTYEKWEEFSESILNMVSSEIKNNTLEHLECMFDILQDLKVCPKEKDPFESVEKSFREVALEIEPKLGCTWDELFESDKPLRDNKIFIMVIIPEYFKRRNRFYYSMLLFKLLLKTFIIKGFTRAINPIVWYRFWKGYWEQR